MQYPDNPQLQLAYNFLQYTNQNVYLTGKAGTGKTTFLRNLKKVSPKRMIVVAPTGVAAINAGGVTIHSFFQMSFGPQIPQDPNSPRKVEVEDDTNVAASIKRFNKEKINIIRSLDLLVIDEISMVRADILDGIDEVLRRYKNRNLPFGGVQLLMIGDLQQLAPVVKEDEWNILRSYYDTFYFFSSRALKQSNFVGVELTYIYRQSDQYFIDLLNKVRTNQLDKAAVELLNQRYKPAFEPTDDEGYITLTTHNYQAQRINESKLNQLKSKSEWYKADVEGDFPDYSYPTDERLELKVGAQVMFVKNDPSFEKLYYNGKIGTVIDLSATSVEVLCQGESKPIIVTPGEWQNARYSLNEKTQEIEESVVGRFIQLPLKLAWAITIHKSQGLTFDKAIIDARQSFAHGQVYVALSRCRSLEGLVLSTPIEPRSVISDTTVVGFSSKIEQNQPDSQFLEQAKKKFELQLLVELFDFRPFIRNVQYFLRVWNENSAYLMGNLKQVFIELLNPVNNEMVLVAEKFYVQIDHLLNTEGAADKNPNLQERVKKAADYFLQRMSFYIENPMDEANFQTDNKTIRKRLTDIFSRIELELLVKRNCLNLVAESGFEVKTFMDVRAKSAIEQPKVKSKRTMAAASVNYPEFYRKLVEWRDDKADELGVEVAKILQQKVMVAIADVLPVTASDLKAIKGMGGTKMNQFGREILALILQFRKDNDMQLPLNAEKEVAFAGLNTREVSLALFNQGKTIAEIARERKLSTTTVEGHLAYYVSVGELDVFKLVDEDTYVAIERVVKAEKVKTLTDAKNKLGDDFSYTQIKMVLADLGW